MVSRTRIFGRCDGNVQYLAYEMTLAADRETAMVLPLPCSVPVRDTGAAFLDLSDYPELFENLEMCFPVRFDRSFGGATLAAPLPVVNVGAFEASFVPRAGDFSRLDPRFRIPPAALEAFHEYADYGFAVFKLRPGESRVHPMGLSFETRFPDRIFFPTVHVHHGVVPDLELFDHTLFAQGRTNDTLWHPAEISVREFFSAKDCRESGRTRGLVSRGAPLYRRRIVGMQNNEDTWCLRAA